MSSNADASNVSRRRFLAVAGTVAAASSFAAGGDASSGPAPFPFLSPPPRATYPVTIDVSDSSNFKYSTPTQPDASTLRDVKPGQTFTWVVANVSNYYLAILFPITPFAVHAFIGSQDDAIQGKIGGAITATDGDYKYWVVVHNYATGKSHTNDPKIIVGKGFDAEHEIHLALGDLNMANEKLSRKPELQEGIKRVENELKEIIRQLQSK
jgi:hypothetical protein